MILVVFGQQINTRYWFSTRRYALISAGIGLFVVGLIAMVIVPEVNSLFSAQQALNRQLEDNDKLNRKFLQLSQLPESNLEPQMAMVNQILPSHKPLLELLSALSETAANNQVEYRDISLNPGEVATEGANLSAAASRTTRTTRPGQQTGVDHLDVKMTINGTLQDLNRFLEAIERVAPLTTVMQISLSETRQDEDVDEAVFDATLDLRSYYFTQSISTTVAAPIPDVDGLRVDILGQLSGYRLPTILDRSEITGGGLDDLFGVEDYDFFVD